MFAITELDRRRQRHTFPSLLLSAVLLVLVPIAGMAEQGGPIRVEVQSKQLEIPAGSDTPITVQLVDAGGTPVPAGKPYEIQVSVAMEGGDSRTVPVTLQRGESGREIMVQALGSGFITVEATNEELLKGATLLRARSQTRLELPSLEPLESREELLIHVPPDIEDEVSEQHSRAMLERQSAEASVGARVETEGEADDARIQNQVLLIEQLSADNVGLANDRAADPSLSLELRAYPDRPLRADGVDPAKIYAFLHGEPDHPGITLTLLNSLGQLTPRELQIPNGYTSGEANLTSDLAGDVTVDLVSTVPELNITGQRNLAFKFHPPIDKLLITAPEKLDISDAADLAVDLVNSAGTPVKTMERRKVRFQVLKGKVRVRDSEFEIQAGQSGARTELSADWWGNAVIEVSTPNLSKQRISIAIGLPWSLLAVTALGGMLGGLIAWAHGPEKYQHLVLRLLVGLVAGFMAYWLLAYLMLPGTSNLVLNMAVRNAFGAFCSSVVGGWLGTEILDAAARRLGLAPSAG